MARRLGLLGLFLLPFLLVVTWYRRSGPPRPAAPELVQQACGACHRLPPPDVLPRERWRHMLAYMEGMIGQHHLEPAPTREQWFAAVGYYMQESPRRVGEMMPTYRPSALTWDKQAIGKAPLRSGQEPPLITNVNIVDLEGDERPEVLVCDGRRHTVAVISRTEAGWRERQLAGVVAPAHTVVLDFDGDGDRDIAVAGLGSTKPTNDAVGSVAILVRQASGRFEARTILRDVPRVADVEPGDFDGDGDVDFIVAMFGGWTAGSVAWLEQTADGAFALHGLDARAGSIHVPTADLNGDGHLDFVALISQQHEVIVAFLNGGAAAFTPHELYRAPHPLYGSSGIELVDLDQDGDVDVLYTNGDALDIDPHPKPFHGVQWLENTGGLRFVYHDIVRFYGTYRAVAGDLDDDGDLDIVAASQTSRWDDPAHQSLIWLENDGAERFTAHAIANAPTHLATAALGDVDADGRLDIVAGSLHAMPPFGRLGRVTLWTRGE